MQDGVTWKRQDLFAYRPKEPPRVSSGQIRASDRTCENALADEGTTLGGTDDASRRMAGGLADLELDAGEGEPLAVREMFVGWWGLPHGQPEGRGLLGRRFVEGQIGGVQMHRYRVRAHERLDSSHVVHVGRSEEDGDRHAIPSLERLLHPLRFESRIDDERLSLAVATEEKAVGEKRPELEP